MSKIAKALRVARSKRKARGGSVEGDGKDDVSYGGTLPRSLQPMTTQIPDSWMRVPPKSYADGGSAGDNYNTALSPEQERAFQVWKSQNAPNDSGVDYDLRGAYLANMQRSPDNGHMGDQFKKPNHPTFSDQSQYAPFAPHGTWAGPEGPNQTFVPPSPMAEGGETLSDADQAAMMPETYVNPYAKHLVGGLAEAAYSIPKNFVEGSQDSMSDNGVGELSPKSAQASGDLVMQGVANAAGVRANPGATAGVFVGPYGAHMLRDADRAALKPHPVIGEELAQKSANLRPEFRDIYKGAVQDMRDAEGRGILEMRQGSGNTADQDVWDRSGWFRGADGMPRKEIPDVNSRLVPVEGKPNEFRIDHPAGDFHKIYDVPNIKFDPNIPRRNGTFNPATNQIILGGNPTKSNIEAARSDSLHELMHAIQKKEGFAKGSSEMDANLNPRSPIAQEIFEIKDGRLVPSWQEYIKNKDPDWRSTYSAYMRSAGEAEPFNVQDRLAKSYKYLIKPEYTERTGRGLQWVNPNNMARPRNDIKIHDLSAMGPNDAIPPEGAHTVGQISRGNAFRNYARDLVENKASGGSVGTEEGYANPFPGGFEQTPYDQWKAGQADATRGLQATYRDSTPDAQISAMNRMDVFNNQPIPPNPLITSGQMQNWDATSPRLRSKFNNAADGYVTRATGGPVGNFNPERAEAFGLAKQGMISSSVPGRTDKLNLNVPSGSYVIPADIPSALGQGNTMAGSAILDRMFTKGPYGMNLAKSKAGTRLGSRTSSLTKKMRFAKGGATGEPTPIIAAGGEYIVHPESIHHLGNGDIALGHSILDAFVKHVRSKNVKTLQKLKPPKGSK